MNPQIMLLSELAKKFKEGLLTEDQAHELYGSEVMQRIKHHLMDEQYAHHYA